MMRGFICFITLLGMMAFTGCQSQNLAAPADGKLQVLVVESFLADIVSKIAGERVAVQTLIPRGVDPHSFEPTPRDLTIISEADALVLNGAGFEEWLAETLQSTGVDQRMILASDGLQARTPQPGETADEHGGSDPHFWLDPTQAMAYVENIRIGLTRLDPAGEAVYTANATAYLAELQSLDEWIAGQVELIPPAQRLLVTNHASFGYFADRYGFKIIGTIIPSASSSASPSAQQMASLVEKIRQAGARAVFLETGTNPELAEQIANDTGVRVVSGLYSHSLSEPDGPAPTYVEMMRYNTRLIVEALQ